MSVPRPLAEQSAWPIARLGDIAEVRLGKMLDKAKHRTGTAMPYLRNINVRWGAVKTDDLLEMFFKEGEHERYGLRAGDVLVCEGGEPGRAAVWDGRIPEVRYQKALHRVRFNAEYEPRLLVYLLELLAKTGRLERRFTGSTIKHLTRESLVELPIPVPPLDEQRRMVEEIEQQLTRLDAGVAALKRVQANLKRYRAAVLKSACEGRLVPTEAALARQEGRPYEPASALLARIKAQKVRLPIPPSSSNHRRDTASTLRSDPPRLPEGWAWARWDDVGHSQNGRAFPSKGYVLEGVRLLRPGNLHESGRLRWSENNTKSLAATWETDNPDLVVGPRELVMNLTAQSLKDEFLGRICLTGPDEHCLLNQRLARLTPVLLAPEYCLWMFKSRVFRRFVDGLNKGSLIQHMFTSQLARFLVPVPPLAEQHRIVAEVDRRLSLADALDCVVSARLRHARRLRHAVLGSSFSPWSAGVVFADSTHES